MLKSTLTALRAISAEFAWRLLKPLLILGGVLALLLLFMGGWLTTKDALWWILEFVFITSTVLFMMIAGIVVAILNRLRPPQTKTQKKAVHAFVDKLQRVADTMGISRFVLLYRIVRDVLRPREQIFIKQIAEDSTTLHTDFIKLQEEFKES